MFQKIQKHYELSILSNFDYGDNQLILTYDFNIYSINPIIKYINGIFAISDQNNNYNINYIYI